MLEPQRGESKEWEVWTREILHMDGSVWGQISSLEEITADQESDSLLSLCESQ